MTLYSLVILKWWGIAAWPVDGFVEANDFTGKAVIPFCTAASSGIGDQWKSPRRDGRNRKLVGRQEIRQRNF